MYFAIGWLPAQQNMSTLEEVFYVARANALIALGSTIPGYWFTVATVDYIGRWWIGMGGFFMMTLWMAIIAGNYNTLLQTNVNGFVVFYGTCTSFTLHSPL